MSKSKQPKAKSAYWLQVRMDSLDPDKPLLFDMPKEFEPDMTMKALFESGLEGPLILTDTYGHMHAISLDRVLSISIIPITTIN